MWKIISTNTLTEVVYVPDSLGVFVKITGMGYLGGH